MKLGISLVGAALFGVSAIRKLVFPREAIQRMDRRIAQKGIRAVLRLSAVRTLPAIGLAAFAAWETTFPIFWGIATAVLSFVSLAAVAGSFVVDPTRTPPQRSAQMLAHNVKRKRMSSLVPLCCSL